MGSTRWMVNKTHPCTDIKWNVELIDKNNFLEGYKKGNYSPYVDIEWHNKESEPKDIDTKNKKPVPKKKGEEEELTPFKWGLILIPIAVAIIIVIMRIFIFNTYAIPSSSMENTLMPGDNLIAERLTYKNSEPQNGEIVIYTTDTVYIKRLIAKSGQTVDIRNNQVFVDGQKLDEPYVKGTTKVPQNSIIKYPYKVPDGCMFVMGDNRENSKDSRYIGPIKMDTLEARPIFRFWPLTQITGLN